MTDLAPRCDGSRGPAGHGRPDIRAPSGDLSPPWQGRRTRAQTTAAPKVARRQCVRPAARSCLRANNQNRRRGIPLSGPGISPIGSPVRVTPSDPNGCPPAAALQEAPHPVSGKVPPGGPRPGPTREQTAVTPAPGGTAGQGPRGPLAAGGRRARRGGKGISPSAKSPGGAWIREIPRSSVPAARVHCGWARGGVY